MQDDQNPLISIIIPIYNTGAQNFKNCFESIVNQSYKNYEIIVVDDGSNELNRLEYKNILNSYSSLNVKLYQKNNEGVSKARNYGINKANGEYITFVDGDDLLSKNFLEDACKYVKQGNYDIIIGNMKYSDDSSYRLNVKDEIILHNNEIINLQLALLGEKCSFDYYNGLLFGSPCGRLYKKCLCSKIMFRSGVTHLEDQLFNREYFRYIHSAIIVPKTWYIYIQNEQSAMHYKKTSKNFLMNMKPFWDGWDDLNTTETNHLLKIKSYEKTLAFYNSAIENAILPSASSFNNKKTLAREILNFDIFINAVKNLKLQDVKKFRHKVTYLCMKYKFITLIILLNKYKKNGN